MIRTVAVFVFVSFACVATAFSQTIEKENKIDVQKKNSSAEVSGRQLPEAKNIEPKLTGYRRLKSSQQMISPCRHTV